MKESGSFGRGMRKTIRRCCLLLVCFVFTGCVGDRAAACREYKVYCGMSSPDGEVTEEAWSRFCDDCVSAAFPDGYTVIDATGYWRSDAGATAKERSKIILIVAPAAGEEVRAVAKRYRERFAQISVLISVSDAEAEIVRAEP